jgi:hypothetical protein
MALGLELEGEFPAVSSLAIGQYEGALKAAYLAAQRSARVPGAMNAGRFMGSLREGWAKWTPQLTREALIGVGVHRVDVLNVLQWLSCPEEVAAAAIRASEIKRERAKTQHPVTRPAGLIAPLIQDGEAWASAVTEAKAQARKEAEKRITKPTPAAPIESAEVRARQVVERVKDIEALREAVKIASGRVPSIVKKRVEREAAGDVRTAALHESLVEHVAAALAAKGNAHE